MEQTKLRFVRLRRYVWWLAAIWTVVLSGSLVWNLVSHNMEIKDLALNTARLTIEKDLLLRQWGASHGGVYVPVTAATQPNPYLSQIPERDIPTPSGRLLTLLNPAYMTRQLYELAQQKQSDIQGHSTSLRPANPQNAPDAWETQALQALERGQTEVSFLENREGKSFVRLMRPYHTEKSCLKCHAVHGYKEGDLRGGISVSLSFDRGTGYGPHIFLIWLSHGFILLVGLGLIGLGFCKINQDQREQMQMEEALRKSEEFTRSIIENSPDCIKVLDLEGLLQFMSPAGLKTMKITNFAEYLNFPYLDFFQGENREAAREALDQARHGETGVFLGYCPTLDGVPKWWDVQVSPIFGSNGQVERLVAASRDITAQKQIERDLARYQEHLATMVTERTAELQKTNEKLQQARRDWEEIFQAVGHPTMILDPEHGIIEANRATLAALGKTAAEIKGRKCYEFFHHQDQPPADCPLLKLQNSGQLETREMEVEALEGAYLVSCTPVFDAQGNLQKVIHIATEITVQKRAKEALEQSEKRFKDIAENALEWFWEVDAQGKYVYASPVVEKLIGYQPEELLNKHFYDLFHPDDREKLKEQAFAVIAAKQPFREFLNRNLHKDGREVWLLTSGLPVFDEKGELIGYRGVDTDITERKRAEEALQNERQRLFSLLEQIPAFVCLLAEDYTFSYVNREFRERFGDPGDSRYYEFLFTRQEPCEECHTFRVFSEQKAQLWEWTGPDQNTYAIHDYPFIDIDGSQLILELGVDITTRKQAEEALRESEERYRRITGAVTDYIYSVTVAEGRAVQTEHGPPCVAVTGYTSEEFAADPYLWVNMVLEEDRELVGQHAARLLAGEDPGPIEHRIRRKDGTVRWVSNTPVLHRDSSARLISYNGLISDITTRKRAEGSLKESEERYQSMFENSPLGLWLEDLSEVKAYLDDLWDRGVQDISAYFTTHPGAVAQCADLIKVIDVNKAALEMCGVKSKEELFQGLRYFLIDESYRVFQELIVALAEGLTLFEGEGRIQTIKGNKLHVIIRLSVVPGFERSLGRVLVSIIDISARKLAEDALKQSEEKYRLLVNQIPAGVFKGYADWSVDFYDQKIEDLSGYRKEDFDSRSIKWCDLIPAEDLDYAKRVLIKLIEPRVNLLYGSTASPEKTGRAAGSSAGGR